MNWKLIKVLYTILVVDFVVAQRISESKCDEYESALSQTDPRSKHPSLMEIIDIRNGSYNRLRLATLISEDYVITADLDIYPNILNSIVRKAKVFEEEYPDNKEFSIKRLFYNETTSFTIMLVQLNETISYRDGISIFRPACLWTPSIFPSSLNYTFYGWNASENKSSIEMFSSPSDTITEAMTKSEIFFMINPYYNINFTIKAAYGSPLQVKYQNRNYVVGNFYYYDMTTNKTVFGSVHSSYISWIESTVWPTQSGCGQRKIKHKPLITHGFPTYHGEYPWHVALYKVEVGRPKYRCGGTIINKRTILTAAHCVIHDNTVLRPNELSIVAGIHVLSQYTSETETLLVKTITVHPKYTSEFFENDIAVIKTRGQIKFTNYIQPICLGDHSTFINMTMGTVVGWGNNEHNQLQDVLHQAALPLVTYDDCRNSNRAFFHQFLNNNNYCAGYENGTSICSGDSGGGMIFQYKSQFYIRGIVSLSVAAPTTGQCDVTEFVLFTDVANCYEWIVENMNKATNKKEKFYVFL